MSVEIFSNSNYQSLLDMTCWHPVPSLPSELASWACSSIKPADYISRFFCQQGSSERRSFSERSLCESWKAEKKEKPLFSGCSWGRCGLVRGLRSFCPRLWVISWDVRMLVATGIWDCWSSSSQVLPFQIPYITPPFYGKDLRWFLLSWPKSLTHQTNTQMFKQQFKLWFSFHIHGTALLQNYSHRAVHKILRTYPSSN